MSIIGKIIDKFKGTSQKKPSVGARINARMYQAAKASRLTAGFTSGENTSADAELSSSLRTLRARSRQLVRDAAYAKRAKVVVVNNIIGTGMGVQAQVKRANGKLIQRVNDEIEDIWKEWSRGENCHTGGTLHFSDMERMLMGEVFEGGEVFIRKHYGRFGDSQIPLALEVIEPERLIDEFIPASFGTINGKVRMGVKVDDFRRPVSYFIRKQHPGEIRFSPGETDMVEEVPASDIIHLRIVDRWPQTRGEPWLHAVARKLNDMDGYSEAEITAARGAASYMGFIENASDGEYGAEQEDGTEVFELEPGVISKLYQGEKFVSFNPNRPNSNMDPFMRMMLREVAAGVGVSYESLSRDYSQGNYSSSRLGLLDDRDLWRTMQLWWIRSFREPLHREWMNLAMAARVLTSINIEDYALNIEKYVKVRFKPRGWSWVDPTKEVDAYIKAIGENMTTLTQVIAQTNNGMDIEDVLAERKQELELIESLGLTPVAKAEPASPPAEPPADGSDEGDQGDQGAEPGRARLITFRRDEPCQ